MCDLVPGKSALVRARVHAKRGAGRRERGEGGGGGGRMWEG